MLHLQGLFSGCPARFFGDSGSVAPTSWCFDAAAEEELPGGHVEVGLNPKAAQSSQG